MNEAAAVPKELRRLIKRRESIKSSISSISDYTNKFIPSVSSIRQLQIRLSKLNEFMSDLTATQEGIADFELGHDDDEERTAFEDFVYTLVANMEDLIAKHGLIDMSNSIQATNHSGTSTNEVMKLPTINIPTFDGNLENWASFIDTFNALFHNNPSLTNVQRLHYLKSSVSNAAADVIKSFSITSDNYQAAYDELIKQYENKALTIQTHIRSLLNSPKVHVASATELRKLHHHVVSHVRALKALNQPVQHWDAWLTTIICCHLDPATAGEWQLLQTTKELPAFEEIENFLSKRISAYEVGYISLKTEEKQTLGKQIFHKGKMHENKALFTKRQEPNYINCVLCSASHRIYACDQFNRMSVPDRKIVTNKFKLCFNCLNLGHQVASCKYPGCPRCGKKHNSRLHIDDSSSTQEPRSSTPDMQSSQGNAVLHARDNSKHISTTTSSAMLATAIIYVHDAQGQPHRCRAVLDSGSQLNFITSSCAQRLQLNKTNISMPISGVGTMSSSTVRLMPCTISSHCQKYCSTIEFHLLSTITERLPSQIFDIKQLNIPDFIKNSLADPQFNIPGPVDILFGAELFYDIFLGARQQLSKHICLHNTKLGWIVTGKLFERSLVQSKTAMLSTTTTFNNSALSLFTSTATVQTADEIQVEEHFASTVKRDEDGKFVVRLPVNDKLCALGDSRYMAEKRFFNLEKRFAKDPLLAEQYNIFMSEYLQLNHMELASSAAIGPKYYLPHHPVFKANSITTKLRVVFDGSARTNSGISLNDVLLKGPKVQPDIFNILLRFRIHQVVITADVEKMYRQVLISPEDRDLQRILYRKCPRDQLLEYRLRTVTYGTKAASYLATRCLAEIGKAVENPKLRRVISEDFYVDDLLSGGSSEEECYVIYKSLLSHLSPAGFPLRKWCSNSVNLINQIPTACDDPTFVLRLTDEDMVTALGLTWQPVTDQFRFTIKQWTPPPNMTKRTLLSDINSVYDPIGLISPALILGKIFIQQLWGMKLNWDDILPMDLQTKWIKFYNSLQSLQEVVIPRKAVCAYGAEVTIHGFCDASKEAFGACIYLHSVSSRGHVQVHLLTSKSRVAPMKATTIPRLELCGALLLAELLLEVKNELNCLGLTFRMEDISLWTDSSIVLAWLKNEVPLQSYVSNRVARILDSTIYAQWHHVPSMDNPADLITRGIHPYTLSSCSIWWNGPSWLCQNSSMWPGKPDLPTKIPEVRPTKLVLAVTQLESSWLLNRYSNYMRLIRITSLIQRFIHNCKISKHSGKRAIGALTVQDLNLSKDYWIRTIQAEAYPSELRALKLNLPIHRSSCLVKLNPFVDDKGILRVGGRLAYAPISDNAKFPIVLPPSTYTRLYFKYEHQRLFHVGPQALLSQVHVNYWPIRGRNLASRVVHQCLQCFRTKPTLTTPFMAPLPRHRTTMERPFFKCGVDFCGPLMIRSGVRRVQSVKAYVSVFVCFVTRAVHLELVSSLATDAFLAALNRFFSRRGQCGHIFSDNGTNFVGAHRKLNAQFKEIAKTHAASSFLAERSIQWHFIPPAAPHFGGLWEAAVKSAKQHLTKITMNSTFTFEEATTVLCGIEAVLNSRPMTPLSNDPSEYKALTPAHFLIGGIITQPAAPDVSTTPLSRLKRFIMVQSCIQQFWKRWSKEYLPQLQRRGRWTKVTRNFRVGDLCLLRHETLPPTKWALVRVQEVHPGLDGAVRVVTLRNSSGTLFKRPVVKLSLLPTEEDEEKESQLSTN